MKFSFPRKLFIVLISLLLLNFGSFLISSYINEMRSDFVELIAGIHEETENFINLKEGVEVPAQTLIVDSNSSVITFKLNASYVEAWGKVLSFSCNASSPNVRVNVIGAKKIDGFYELLIYVAREGNVSRVDIDVYGTYLRGTRRLGNINIRFISSSEELLNKEGEPINVGMLFSKAIFVPRVMKNSSRALFDIEILNGSITEPYLRTSVGLKYIYGKGIWLTESFFPELRCEKVRSANERVGTLTILIKNIALKHVVLSKKGVKGIIILNASKDLDLVRYKSTFTFQVRKGVLYEYILVVDENNYVRYNLINSNVPISINCSLYLQVPEGLREQLRALALHIINVSRSKTVIEKILAIAYYLLNNYKYDTGIEFPDNVDPIEYFLFKSKRGTCIHFNSALVLLLRSIGIPSRLVIGYMINPIKRHQVIKESDMHAWAEVLISTSPNAKPLWITFDVTPTVINRDYKYYGLNLISSYITKVLSMSSKLFLIPNNGSLIIKPGEVAEFIVNSINSQIKNVHMLSPLPKGIKISISYENSTSVKLLIRTEPQLEDGVYQIPLEILYGYSNITKSKILVPNIIVRRKSTPFIVKAEKRFVSLLRGSSTRIRLNIIPQISSYRGHKIILKMLYPSDINAYLTITKGTLPFVSEIILNTTNLSKLGLHVIKITGTDIKTGSSSFEVVNLNVVDKAEVELTTVFPEYIVKGKSIYVEGVVVNQLKEPIPNVNVHIFLRKDKASTKDQILLGILRTDSKGRFYGNLTVPLNIPVGVYHIVAVFPGTDYVLNGTSDPTITVLSRPIIRLSIPYVVLKDTILNIHGEVLDMDGSKIHRDLKIIVYLIHNDNVMFKQEIKSNDGSFSISFPLKIKGVWKVKVFVEPPQFYLSNTLEKSFYAVEYDLKAPSEIIRGTEGTVKFHIDPIPDLAKSVVLEIVKDNKEFFICEKNLTQGYITFSVKIDDTYKLGPYSLTIILKSLNETLWYLNKTLIIKAKTAIDVVKAPSRLKPGQNYTVLLRIVDAYYPKLGIGSARVLINGDVYMSNITGYVLLKGYVPKNFKEKNVKLIIRCTESKYYLPSQYVLTIPISPSLYRRFYVFILPFIFIAGTSMALLYLSRKKKILITTPSHTKNPHEFKSSPLRIQFPDLEHFMPLIWSPGEEFRARAIICIDGNEKPVDAVFLVNGKEYGRGIEVKFRLFTEGEYIIEAKAKVKGKNIVTRKNVRIAHYYKEVVRLYNDIFLAWLKKLGLNIKEMTPEEIFFKIASGEFKGLFAGILHDKADFLKELRNITNIFEEARYSTHNIDRHKFRSFCLSLHRIGLLRGELNA